MTRKELLESLEENKRIWEEDAKDAKERGDATLAILYQATANGIDIAICTVKANSK